MYHTCLGFLQVRCALQVLLSSSIPSMHMECLSHRFHRSPSQMLLEQSPGNLLQEALHCHPQAPETDGHTIKILPGQAFESFCGMKKKGWPGSRYSPLAYFPPTCSAPTFPPGKVDPRASSLTKYTGLWGSRRHTKKCGPKISKPSASLEKLRSQSQLRAKRPQWYMRLCLLQFFIGISHLRSIQALSQVCLTFGKGGCAMQYEPPLARVEIVSTWHVS